MPSLKSIGLVAAALLGLVAAQDPNFDFESAQLSEEDIAANAALAFGDAGADAADSKALSRRPKCKVQPTDKAWPSVKEWGAFNKSLGGVLLKPTPPGAACYPDRPEYDAEQCQFLVDEANDTRFWINNPLGIFTEWTQGNTCVARLDPEGECTQGGFPDYAVRATEVKHVQMAVNFARNHNIRLVIKNSGHDFLGRSTGKGALSIWIHNMKGVEIIDGYTLGEYSGKAAKLSGGTEGFEAVNTMNQSDVTWVASGAATLGQIGGWSQGGGHSLLSGYWGLGADQILSLNVVTADGRFVTANVKKNKDLFFALRGGGGGTYGVVTSAVVRTFPGHMNLSGLSYSFTVGPKKVNASIYDLFTIYPSTEVDDIETFWAAYLEYVKYVELSAEKGGFGLGDITPQGSDSYTFASMFAMPGMTASEAQDFLEPLFEKFRALGIDIEAAPAETVPYAEMDENGTGLAPRQSLFASRLIPRSSWQNPEKFTQFTTAIRTAVEEGQLQVRSRCYAPTLERAGYPTTSLSSGVNPALRETLMHCTVFPRGGDVITADTSPQQWKSTHDKLTEYMTPLREATAESGAYTNEADAQEPDWQQSFWGSSYAKLAGIKRRRDPWGVFWSQRTPGSEGWEVVDGSPVEGQNGPLCRTGE